MKLEACSLGLMKRRRLGRTGLVVSEICLGTMTFGNQADDRTSFAILDRAYEAGVDFFDIAEVYPVPFSGFAVNDQLLKKNPEIVKKWLRAHVRALLFIRQNPEESAQVAAKELKLNLDVAREAIQQAIGFLSPDDPGGFTERGIRLHIQYSAARTNVDPEKVKIADVADASLLREVQREMGIQCRGGYLCPQGAVK